MRLNTIPISDYRQSIEPVDFFEPGDRYKSADDEDEFMDYHEDDEREWMDKHEEDQ